MFYSLQNWFKIFKFHTTSLGLFGPLSSYMTLSLTQTSAPIIMCEQLKITIDMLVNLLLSGFWPPTDLESGRKCRLWEHDASLYIFRVGSFLSKRQTCFCPTSCSLSYRKSLVIHLFNHVRRTAWQSCCQIKLPVTPSFGVQQYNSFMTPSYKQLVM